MIKNQDFSPQLNKNSSQFNQMPFNQSQIIEIEHLDLNFMNSSNSKKKFNKNTGSATKIKPSTDRIYNNDSKKKSLGNTLDLLKSGTLQCNHFDQNNNKTDRETLLQKKKSYAQSIRQKNKQILQNQNSQKSRNKGSNYQSINLNTSSVNKDVFTPPKEIKNKQNACDMFAAVESQYYSSSKKLQNLSGVFKQSNTNRQNLSMTNTISNNSVFNLKDHKTKISNVTSKIKSIMNNTIDLNNCYELSGRVNGNSTSKKNDSISNKENKIVIPSNPPPLSGKKSNQSARNGSYAQIFDKKVTINALLNHQKNPNSLSGLNGSIRRLNSTSNKKQSLKSIALQQQDFEFGDHQLSKNLDYQNYSAINTNGYTVQQFSQTIEQISQICQAQQDQKNQEQQTNKTHQNLKNLTLNSYLYAQTIDFTQIYKQQRLEEEKQILILAKQNGTFKKQLATFRKQNSTVRKQLENCKKYIQQLEQKAKKLLEEQELSKSTVQYPQTPFNAIKNSQSPINDLSSSACSSFIYPIKFSSESQTNNLQTILQNTEQQLFSLKSDNKALQLKVYMLQKKLVHEQQLNKKRLALQVNNWKQKYNKLRNQHLRTKNSFLNNPFMNSDWSISMEMSRDQ